MNRSLLTGAAVAVLVLSGGGAVALAQTPTTCSAALSATISAEQKAVQTQAEVDRLRAAQTPLDAAVVAAEKALAAETDPLKIPALQTALTLAKNLAGTGNDKLQAAIAADAAADSAAVAARALSDRLCTGPSGTVTVTPPPPAPIVVTIPRAINTGRA